MRENVLVSVYACVPEGVCKTTQIPFGDDVKCEPTDQQTWRPRVRKMG